MKLSITIMLALSIVVTLVAFSLMFARAASDNQASVRTSSGNHADARASSGKYSDSELVGASVPPEYHYDPINAIYLRDDGKDVRHQGAGH